MGYRQARQHNLHDGASSIIKTAVPSMSYVGTDCQGREYEYRHREKSRTTGILARMYAIFATSGLPNKIESYCILMYLRQLETTAIERQLSLCTLTVIDAQ